jgi:hypothetical protein
VAASDHLRKNLLHWSRVMADGTISESRFCNEAGDSYDAEMWRAAGLGETAAVGKALVGYTSINTKAMVTVSDAVRIAGLFDVTSPEVCVRFGSDAAGWWVCVGVACGFGGVGGLWVG